MTLPECNSRGGAERVPVGNRRPSRPQMAAWALSAFLTALFVLLAPAGVWAQEDTEVRLSIEAIQSSVDEGASIRFRITASTCFTPLSLANNCSRVNLDKPLLAVLSFETERAGVGWPYDTTATAYIAIAAGSSRKTFTVPTVENIVGELDGVVTVRIEEPDEAAMGAQFTPYVLGSPSSAEVSVRDNDVLSTTIDLTLDPVRVAENDGRRTVTVTATLNAGTRPQATVVNVTVAGNTAEAEDFAEVNSFNVTIPATLPSGQNTFSLTPVNDAIAEGNETLQVSGSVTGLTVTPATLTIRDDDTASTGIELTLDPERVREDGGQQTVTVTATLDAGTHTFAILVIVTVAGNTATVADDFAAVGNVPITIPANQPSGTADISLTPVNDGTSEGDETLTVRGTAALPVTAATLTLADDDTASSSIALSLDPDEVTEEGGQQTVTVTARLNAGTRTQDTVVQVTVTGVTATVGTDFAAVNAFNITISQGAISGQNTFMFAPVDDDIAEVETLTVSGTAMGLSVGQATLTLRDTDIPRLTMSPASADESDGQITFMVTLLDPNIRTVRLRWETQDGTATAGQDYTARHGFLLFSPLDIGQRSLEMRVPILQDQVDEHDETLLVAVTSVDNAVLENATTTGTIRDDDDPPTGIALTLARDQVGEGDGVVPIRVTATLNANTRSQATVVQVTVAGDTATVGDDFATVSSFNVTIPPRRSSGQNTFIFIPLPDVIAEGDETLTVSGISPLPVTSAELTIRDDYTASSSIALSLNPDEVTEDGGQQTVTVTAMLNAGARTADTVVNVSVGGDTATVVDDFAAVGNFQITILATQTSGEADFSLTPVNDGIAEGNETLQVSGTGALTVTSAELTLTDDDTASTGIALSLDPEQVTEQGGQQTVTVTAALNAGTRTADTVVTVSVAGDTATVVDDFATVGNFQITILATQTSGEADFSLTPVNDGIAEGNETLQVSGTGALTVTSAELTLTDDDTASTGIALSLDPEQVTEQGGQQTVTVTAMLNAGARTADTVVNVSVGGDTATVVDDFAAVGNFQITILATQTSATGTFSLTPVNDGIAEGNETLQVSGTGALTVTSAELTLTDDDTASTGIALSLDPEQVTEQGGQQTVTVTAALNAGTRTADTVVTVSVAGDTATVVDDFATVGNFQITILATQTSATGTFSLTPVNDAIAEGDETLTVSGTATGLTVDGATLTLDDDDTASTGIELTLNPTQVTEQGGQQTVTVTAMLNAGAHTAATVVNVSVAGDTATVVDDFATVGNFSITIPANQPSATGTFSLTPVNDAIAEGAETLTVSGTATGLSVDGATLTLDDDDTASTGIELTLNPTRVTEQGGQQTVTVTATLNAGARTQNTVVQVTVAGDTATVGDDFGPRSHPSTSPSRRTSPAPPAPSR